MSDHHEAYRHIEETVTKWAESRPDVQGVLVVGSRARQDVEVDESSDLDLTLFADNPNSLIDSDDWLPQIGPVVLSFVEGTAVGGRRQRRAVFEPMLDIDFSIVPSGLLDIDFADPGPLTNVIRPAVDRGFRITYDPSGRLAALYAYPVSPRIAWELPDKAAFANLVVDFWYHAMWTTRALLHGDLPSARKCLDQSMKDKVLHVINWLAHLGKPDIDTGNGERFFERWSDQEIDQSFHGSNGGVYREQILGDLTRTMDLFGNVAHDAAQRLSYPYPDEAESHVRGWIREAVPDTLP